MMSDQLMDFSGRTGQELFRLLTQRASEELSGQSDFERFTATLAAALIPVAEALRGPIEQARDADRMADEMIEFSSRQLRRLLEPVLRKGQG
jgi:dihydrodipicolinate reductase